MLKPKDYTSFHYLIATANTLTLQSDGVTTVTGATSTADVSNAGAALYLFTTGGNTDVMAELVGAKGPITCADVANLTAYFTTKYAL
jgi:acetaldehyde dehydrogenase (acetylating)